MLEVPGLDGAAMADARALHMRLAKPAGSLGRLEELSVWLAGAQGSSPPHPPRRPVLVIVAGDHGVAARDVSAYPARATAQMVMNVHGGGAAANVLARQVGATVRVIDAAVDADTPPDVAALKVRRGSGSIDREDALAPGEAQRAVEVGRLIADQEVDSGADLLLMGDIGVANSTTCAVIVGVVTGAEPIAVVGRGAGIDDAGWMRKTSAIRDAMRRGSAYASQVIELLSAVGGADLAVSTGLLVQAAVRRTPVLLDGLASCTCALLASMLAPDAVPWWVAATRSTEPAQRLALQRLGLEPLLDLQLRLGEGTGALLALPLIAAAAATLSEMAACEEADGAVPPPGVT